MTAMTVQLAMAIAIQCLPPSLAPIAVGIAQQESGLHPLAVHSNTNGTQDYGLGQVNSGGFGWLSRSLNKPVNERTILDPCLNMQASIRVLFAKYNGNPPDIVKAAYAAGVFARIRGIDSIAAAPSVPPPTQATPLDQLPRPVRAGRDLLATRQ